MSDSMGSSDEKFDGLKWAIIILLVAGGVYANYYFTDQVAWALRLTGGILLSMVCFALFLRTEKGRDFWSFAKECRVEMRKVVWPTRDETVQSTITVALMVVVMSILLWCVDSLLMVIVGLFTG